MNKTATIYSKEEALAMPPNQRPMCYRVPSKIYHDTFEAMGAASMCWEPRPTGQFDSSLAEKFTVELLFKIADELEKAGLIYEKWPEAWSLSDKKTEGVTYSIPVGVPVIFDESGAVQWAVEGDEIPKTMRLQRI